MVDPDANRADTQAEYGSETEMLAEIKRLTPLATFGEKVLEDLKESTNLGCTDMDVETLDDFAVQCGLMKLIAYDPKVHSEIEGEEGDMIYWWGKKEAGDDQGRTG